MKTPIKKTHGSHSLEPRNTSVVVTSLMGGNSMPQISKKSQNDLPPHYSGVSGNNNNPLNSTSINGGMN